jgi:hypothetical protein
MAEQLTRNEQAGSSSLPSGSTPWSNQPNPYRTARDRVGVVGTNHVSLAFLRKGLTLPRCQGSS